MYQKIMGKFKTIKNLILELDEDHSIRQFKNDR